ncbi:hypothetical protein M408DRAFT_331217 [Serendipita vermifera MAFF 305830]|uniref:Uncharacterized protein n=1 Tax=Serendipita vermifera MAFF 305830 TaxID=933852 RepID=A0A0C3ALL1_SERVB|nr:hypothetical protein M408DRAFT_331217 [Serendipita vermifera MAFF 305830]
MYTSTILSVALVATLAAAAPLELGYDNAPAAGDAHAATLTKAKNDANNQIKNMRATLANPNDPVNKQRIHDAFGPKANIAEISKTVEKLHTGTLQVASANPALADAEKGRPALAKVSLNRNQDGSFNSMGSAKIGSRFHKTTFSDK